MRIKIRDIAFAIPFCLIATVALADSPAPNKKWKTSSPDGKYSIEMTPKSDYGEEGEGIVTHYSSGEAALWKVNWFARLVALSNDGVHLVRFGPWASDKKGLSDLAIAFYNKDKLLKEYLVRDLVRNRTKLEETKSHYYWQANKSSIPQGFSADNKAFTVVTLDGIAYKFNVLKGSIIEQKQVPHPPQIMADSLPCRQAGVTCVVIKEEVKMAKRLLKNLRINIPARSVGL